MNPVTFAPGRARLVTTPVPAGSLLDAMTMGIVSVARLAASAAGAPLVTITSRLRRMSSTAKSGNRSGPPSAARRERPHHPR